MLMGSFAAQAVPAFLASESSGLNVCPVKFYTMMRSFSS